MSVLTDYYKKVIHDYNIPTSEPYLLLAGNSVLYSHRARPLLTRRRCIHIKSCKC